MQALQTRPEQLSLLDLLERVHADTEQQSTALVVQEPVANTNSEPTTTKLPWKYPIPLRPYQIDGADHLRTKRRAMLTYQPGLGKTETAIAACIGQDALSWTWHYQVLVDDDGDYVEHTQVAPLFCPTIQDDPQNPLTLRAAKVVICCPSFLMDEWFDRILHYLPHARVVQVSGTRAERLRTLALNADWYIINYEMLHTRELSPAMKQRIALGTAKHTPREPYPIPQADYYIFDESHKLKNHNGKQPQAAAEMVYPTRRVANVDADTTADTANPTNPTLVYTVNPFGEPNTTRQDYPWPCVFLLSGTPIKREPDDLYMQMHILYPREGTYPDPSKPNVYFRSYNDFVRNYCIYLPSPYGNRVVGTKGQSRSAATPVQQLMDEVAHYISYEDADIYRPEVQIVPIRITLDDKYQEAYDEIARTYAYQDVKMYSAIEVLHALRACTSCPAKVATAINLADQFPNVMYYTYYVASTKKLARELGNATNTTVPWIAGTQETPKHERARILASNPQHLVGTVGSLSIGINSLTYMKAVTFYEEDWTPDVFEQAVDRVRRFGNETKKIMVYVLMGKGTIDEHIHAVMGRRGVTSELIVRRTLAKWRKDHKG